VTFGGYGVNKQVFAKLRIFDIDENAQVDYKENNNFRGWKSPELRAHHGACVVDKWWLVVHGGVGKDKKLLNDWGLFDFKLKAWVGIIVKKDGSSFLPTLRMHTLTAAASGFYMFGGLDK